MRIGVKTMAAAMLVLSLGLHWALLQTVAWTGMLIVYAQDASLPEAVAKTFDGNHPCPLCKVIQKGRAEEKESEQKQVKLGFKLDVAPVWLTAEFVFACDRHHIPSVDLAGLARSDPPPKPHPRGFLSDNSACA